MRVWAIGVSNIRRMLRERSNIFFVFVFPIGIILLIGAQFGGGVEPVIGLYLEDDGVLAEAIAAEVESRDGIEPRRFETEEDLFSGVERGSITAGLSLPSGMDETAAAGETVQIGFVARTEGAGPQLQAILGSSVARVMKPVGAAQFASAETDASFDETVVIAREIDENAAEIEVRVSAVGETLFPASLGRFDLGAVPQLILHIPHRCGSAALILTLSTGHQRGCCPRRHLWDDRGGGVRWSIRCRLLQACTSSTHLHHLRCQLGDPIGACSSITLPGRRRGR
jgi:ABC-2 type transport system permease protein